MIEFVNALEETEKSGEWPWSGLRRDRIALTLRLNNFATVLKASQDSATASKYYLAGRN